MVYPPVGRPDMTLSLPVASAGIGARALTGLMGFLLLLGGVGDAAAQSGLIAGSVCSTSGPITGIPDVAAANGRVVAAVAEARSGAQAAKIALMGRWGLPAPEARTLRARPRVAGVSDTSKPQNRRARHRPDTARHHAGVAHRALQR